MEVELVCPRGHQIRRQSEGFISFSPLGNERLNVRVECFECGKEWNMSLRLFTCTEKKLAENSLSPNFLPQ